MTNTFVFVIMFTLMLINGSDVFASGFHLKSIGNVETGGRQISHWWYTSTKPVLHGEATPGAAVTIDVDGTALQINADSSGNWDFGMNELTAGDHQVTLTSSGSTVKFTLTIGNENVDWTAVESGSGETLPTVGWITPTLLLLISGLGIVVAGGKMILNVNKN